MQKLTFTISGVAPLLMHNGRLADQSDPYTRQMKEISAKRKKVDSDFEEMGRLEFLGSLYLNEDNEPCIPSFVFEACLIGRGGAARKEKMGKEAAAALWVVEDAPLIYDGPRNPDELWKDKKFVSRALVRVGQARVTRTRPIFKEWKAEFVVEFNPELLNEESVRRWVEVASEQVGLCDWRPRFGRFEVDWSE